MRVPPRALRSGLAPGVPKAAASHTSFSTQRAGKYLSGIRNKNSHPVEVTGWEFVTTGSESVPNNDAKLGSRTGPQAALQFNKRTIFLHPNQNVESGLVIEVAEAYISS
jgi:hypothetical protein